ncbi:hypothetical protein Q5M85_21190 [Paraclostridium bifermentans]|nr:hypothetical protein [Paraclostridium bifermentans]
MFNFLKAIPICGISILNLPEDKHLKIKNEKNINNEDDYFNV